MDYLEELDLRAGLCTACGACESRIRPLMGAGKFGSPIMVITDQPNITDDKKGALHSSGRGKKLKKMLAMGRLRVESLYYATVIKCYPGRASQEEKEIYYPAKCKPFIREQIFHCNPVGAIIVGQTALRWALLQGSRESANDFNKWNGKILTRPDLYGSTKFLVLEDPYSFSGRDGDQKMAANTRAIHTLREYVVAKMTGGTVPLLDMTRVLPNMRSKKYKQQDLFTGGEV